MPYLDQVVGPSSIRTKRSSVAGEAPTPGALRPGETAINAADSRLFIGGLSGEVTPVVSSSTTGTAGATAILNIVTLSQTDYTNLTPKVATTLYVVAPDPA